jgi:hypothetical protein
MDIQDAYREVGTYRGGAEICGTTPKTVRRVVRAAQAAQLPEEREHNYESVREIVAAKVEKTEGKITATRLLRVARAAEYSGAALASRLHRRAAKQGSTPN